MSQKLGNWCEESEPISIPVTASGLRNIDVALPEIAGTYSVSLQLTTKGSTEIHTVSITGSYADASGAGDYAAGETVSIHAGTRTDYTFAGWTSSDVELAEPNNVSTTFTMPERDVSLTANWKSDKSHTVTFDSQGGSSVPSQSIEDGQTASRPPNPTRNSYIFEGWYTSPDYTQTYDFKNLVTSDFTLYAKWSFYSGGGGGGGGGGGSNSTTVNHTVSVPSRITGGNVSVNPKNAKSGDKITVTISPNRDYALETLTVKDANGSELSLDKIGDNQYMFIMPNSRVKVDASFTPVDTGSQITPSPIDDISEPPDDIPDEIVFSDVEPGKYYSDAVEWAVQRGITNGKTPTTFEPATVCTRANAVTFLWRAAGCPVPTSDYNPFKDVLSGKYYYTAVLWAVQNGITNGQTATSFEPDSVCNRGQIVTFLYRSSRPATTSGDTPFVDVPQDAYYYDAVKWAADTGVTLGTTSTTFSPAQNCNRGQIVTFLYRHFVE